MGEQCCGRCRLFVYEDDTRKASLCGVCRAAVPDAIRSAEKIPMHENSGRRCPCFKPKPEGEGS
jgi:hypothetical protein